MFFCSCNNENVKNEKCNDSILIVNNNSDTLNHFLIKKALNLGDDQAYSDVYSNYWKMGKQDDLFLAGLVFGNKYKSGDAYYNLYCSFTHSNLIDDFNKLDSSSKYLAYYFLLKAKEIGDEQAKWACEEIYKNKKIPKSSYYLYKIAEHDDSEK